MDYVTELSSKLIDALFAILIVMYLERSIKKVREDCAPDDTTDLDKT